MKRKLFFLVAVLTIAGSAFAQLAVPSDGSDGELNPNANVTVDLSQASTADWDTPSTGGGVYDPAKWAVVFKYSSVNIASGRTVTFTNHPSAAPVVWLVSGSVTINGTVNLNGQDHYGSVNGLPGPGGFRSGVAGIPSSRSSGGGFGPGGGGTNGTNAGSAGSYGTRGSGPLTGTTYGNFQILPLIGGSGGAGHESNTTGRGGAGGGAILIVASGTITVNGSITANGGAGHGSGSGGAIRLVANALGGSGTLKANGGRAGNSGGEGRVRLEANSFTTSMDAAPVASTGAPDNPVLIWPPAAAPTVRVVSVGQVDVPSDPRAAFDSGPDVTLNNDQVQVILEASNVPATSLVTVRVVPRYGNPVIVTATPTGGTLASSTWTAQVTLPRGYSVLQARAELR